jgi:acetyl esterase/lipase
MPLSLGARLLKSQLRLAKPLERFTDFNTMRIAQDQLGRVTAAILKTKVVFEPVDLKDFSACYAISTACETPCDRAILYLHGGGYTAGGLDYAKGFGALLAAQTRLSVFCAAYRLAPEHPFPAAQDDALTAYRYLLDQGYEPGRIAVVGESAGGGLSFSLAMRLRDEGIPLPACLVAISPWADLSLSGDSYRNNEQRDPTLLREVLEHCVSAYAPGRECEAYVSPVFGEADGLPPCLLFAGGDEILLSDSVTLQQKLSQARVRSTLVVEKGMWHVYPLYGTPESKKALEEMALFIRMELNLEL